MAEPLRVRYFGAARAAAGAPEEELPGSSGLPLTAVLAQLAARHGPQLARVLDRCSYLRNAQAVHDPGVLLDAGDTVDVLPPFAGG